MTLNPVGDNEAFSAVYWSAMVNAHAAEHVVSGCAPSDGTGTWEVDIASGTIYVGGSEVSVNSQTVTLTAADGSNPRVDIITINSSGTASATDGTAAADPAAPDIPSDEVLIAATHLGAGASAVTASDIHDYRIIADGPATAPIYGDGSDGAITRSADANENGVIMATTYTVQPGVTLTVTGGILIVYASDSITIDGTIDASGQGGGGGSGGGGRAAGNDGASGFHVSGGTGGVDDTAGGTASGGGGGSGVTNAGHGGDDGTRSITGSEWTSLRGSPFVPAYQTLYDLTGNPSSGAGGGGGGGDSAGGGIGDGGTGGNGGNGGGIVILISPSISGSGTIDTSGADGANGGASSDADAGGGGGGGGGNGGPLVTVTPALTGITHTNNGGSGGSGGSGGANANDGAPGGAGQNGPHIEIGDTL